MKPTPATALQLLHSASFGALATHAAQMPGYPFATALPFAPDELHRPVFLVSTLAEHTKNLAADPHASLLVTDPHAQDVLDAPRMTIIGDATQLEASPELIARFVRYQPQAEQYLALGDFSFYALSPKRVRYIAGFAQMGWIEENEWFDVKPLPLADEARIIAALDGRLPANLRALGVDRYGVDLIRDGKRERKVFASAPLSNEALADKLRLL